MLNSNSKLEFRIFINSMLKEIEALDTYGIGDDKSSAKSRNDELGPFIRRESVFAILMNTIESDFDIIVDTVKVRGVLYSVSTLVKGSLITETIGNTTVTNLHTGESKIIGKFKYFQSLTDSHESALELVKRGDLKLP